MTCHVIGAPIIRTTNVICFAAALFFVVSLMPGSGARAAGEQAFTDYTGRLGDLPAGMTLGFADGRVVAGSHYYYRKYCRDIPLTGTDGVELRLSEPGGGVFVLHYVGGGPASHATAENSTGLAGTWSGAGRVLPVALTVAGGDSYVPGHRYADVTAQDDAAFETLVRGFYDAVLAGDRAEAMRFVSFPLRVNTDEGRFFTIRDASTLQGKWAQVFPAVWLKALAAATPHDMFVRNGQVMIGDGLAWFGAGGLEVINAVPLRVAEGVGACSGGGRN